MSAALSLSSTYRFCGAPVFGAPLLKGLMAGVFFSHHNPISAGDASPQYHSSSYEPCMQGGDKLFPPPPRLNLTPGARSPRPPRLPYPRISVPSWQSPGAPLQQVPPKLLQLPTGAQPCRCHPRIRPSAGSFGAETTGVRGKARRAGPLPEFPTAAPAHLTAAPQGPAALRRTRARRELPSKSAAPNLHLQSIPRRGDPFVAGMGEGRPLFSASFLLS